jgi:anti-anti-sigma factor
MREPTGLDIHIASTDAAIVVTPAGELDLSNAADLRATLWGLATDCTNGRGIVLDLGSLDFIDTCGLHLVVDLVRQCMARGVGLAVRPGGFAIQRAFEMSGLAASVPFG